MKRIRFLVVVIVAVAIGGILGKFVWNGVEFRAFVPNIVVSAESLGPAWLTNTLLTTLIVDAVIVVLALLARRGIAKDGSASNTTPAFAWETLVDLLYRNPIQPALGKRARVVVPIAITAFVFILVSAAFVLIPGVESVGALKLPQAGLKGWCVVQIGGVTLVTGVPVDETQGYDASCGRPAPAVTGAGAGGDAHPQRGYSITPFLRRPTSDMNTALALALIAFFFVEAQGLRANGWHYFKRFFPVHSPQANGADVLTGVIGNVQAVAGLIELFVELIRILSFAFRLFGSMFAGMVLVLVMGSILPVLLPTVFLGLEFAAGVIQALVFVMLITVFTSLAVEHGE